MRNRLPSLDSYDVQGVTSDEAAQYGDDIRYAVDDLDPITGADGFEIVNDQR
jgi:hypothetical protein